MANLISRLIGAFRSDALALAESRAAEAESQRDYLRAMVTYSGAVETRVDGTWARNTDTSISGSAASGRLILPALRDRARNLEDGNLLACSTLDRTVENVCGMPTRIEPRTSSPAFNDAVRAWWKLWAGTTACDVRGMNTLGQIIRFLYRGKERDGDHGLVLAEQVGLDGKMRPKVQIMEPERLVTPRSKIYQPGAKAQVVDGVEMDSYGAPIRYWIQQSRAGMTADPVSVDARNFIFIRNATRYGETRGVTKFQGGFLLYGMIMGYLESAVIASRVGASSAMISKKRDPAGARNALGSMTVTPKDPRIQHTQSATTEKWVDIQPGTINYMHLDEDLVAFNPSQPQQQLPDAIACFARFVGLKFGLTIEQVLLDFTRTTFSGGKMARNQALETAAIEQEDLYTNVIRRIYQWALSKAIKLGDIRVPPPADYWDHEWIPSAHLSPQPDKDIEVAERAIALGVDARSYIASSLGYFFPDLCRQNREDIKAMEGLPPNNGVNAAATPAAQAVDPNADPNADPNDTNPDDTGAEDVDRLKSEMDTYGVAVRAGAITPQVEDENNFRQRLGLPPMSGDAKAAWAKDKGTRRPITLTPPAGTPAPAIGPASSAGTPPEENPQ